MAVARSLVKVLIFEALVLMSDVLVVIFPAFVVIPVVLFDTEVVSEVTSDAFCVTLAFVVARLFVNVVISDAFVVMFVVFEAISVPLLLILVVFVLTVDVKLVRSVAF